jgi:peptidoglycan hydrolase-like protein with peptidoglycan-binding domain
MNKLLAGLLTLLLLSAFSLTAIAQNANNSGKANTQNENAPKKKRAPIFRANKDQIKQAQAILKQRGFYAGEQTGQLNDDTRGGLKKYQAAEQIKVTGTLNKVTLEKMGITLTDKQKVM